MNRFPKLGLLACLVTASCLFGQFETAEVLGTVRDHSGSVVPKAMVILLQKDTGIESKTTADENGNYDFLNAKVGRYTVTVEAAGFSRFSTTDVTVNVNARQRVDVTLQVGAVTETIEVNGAASALETDTSEHGQVINTQSIVELPLNGRAYSDLALLSTNVHRSPMNLTTTPREGAVNVNGMRSTYNNFMLDGMDNNAYSTSNQGFANQVAQPSPDAVAEFKIITSNFSAEYGRVGGAVVNAALRSGTNELHGTAYEFLRNTNLNAIGYVFGQRPGTFKKPTLQRNQFGATVGGPIVRNKVFFFGDYEGFRQLQKVLNFDSIPTGTDRQGVLPVAVVNPISGTVYQAGSPIPIASVNPFAAKVLGDLPDPTGSGRTNNYQQLLLTRDYTDKYDLKLDGQITDRMSAFLRFSQRKLNQYYQPDLAGPSGGGGNGYIRALSQAAAFGYTWTVTPSSILEFRMGFTHMVAGKQPAFLGGASAQSVYGIGGLPTFPQLTGGLFTNNISGFSTAGGGSLTLGRQATNPQFQNPTTFNPKVNYSFVRGRHAVKVGGEMQIVHTEVMDINPVYGLMAYSNQFSKPTCAQLGQPATCTVPADTASYDLADFIFGLPSQVQLANYLVGSYRQRVYTLYVQDDFRVNSKLTLNLGLRWEYATPRWERDNVLSNFDPAAKSMQIAKDGSISDRALVNPDHRDYGPRLGVAYNFDPKTVFRGGYGISYAFLNRLGSADELGINGPQVVIATINQSAAQLNTAAFIRTQNGFPAGLTSPANFVPANSNVAYIPRDTRWPYVQTWFFSVQRELVKNTVVEVAYTGNHSMRLPIVADYNQALPNAPGGTLGVQQRRPIPSFGAITWVDPTGQSNYNALSVRFEHRFSHGLYVLNSFTWSKALGDSEQALEAAAGVTVANPQNIYNLKGERGPTSFDVTSMNVTTLVYQLPFGKGRRFGKDWNRGIDAVLGGWELNTINSANTGLPVNVIYTPTAANDPTGRIPDYRGLAVMRPNLVGDPSGASGAARLDAYFNKAAFALPTADAPFGTLGRNALRAPGFWQWDLGVNKNFVIPAREGMMLQFRSEFFNLLNHSNFGFPTADITSAAFGTIRTAYPPRQIQFGMKFLF